MRTIFICLFSIVGMVILPWLVPSAWVVVMSKMMIAALFAMAFNLLSGQAGMLSFGHAAYFGVGTFATLHVMQATEAGLGIPTPLLPLAGLMCGLLCGVVCGLFATLRSGVYFSMITLAIAELFFNLAPNLDGVFGGEGGMSSFRMPSWGITFGTDIEVYYLVAVWTFVAIGLMYLYTKTPFGRLTVALRENEQRVKFLGFNTYQSRVLVFSLSAMFSGLAGGLHAITNESANYVLFETGASASVVWAAFIGGTGVFFGPALGAVLLSGFTHLVSDATPLVLLYQGVIFIIVMIYLPKGIGGALLSLKDISGSRPARVVARGLAIVLAMACVAVSTVFTLEFVERFFSTEHFGRMQREQALLPVELAGRLWSLTSPMTWTISLVLAAVGVLLLKGSVSLARASSIGDRHE